MNNLHTRWRRAILLFGVWTLVALIFTAISYAAAIGENSRHFGLVDALRLNLVQFYLWGFFSLFIFQFSRRFSIEFRRRKLRNLFIHVPAVFLFADLHQTVHLAILWSITPRYRQQYGSVLNYYGMYFWFGVYVDLIIASLIVIAVHAFLYYQNFRAGELEQSSLRAQLAQAQLRALKMQLQPHFLFNTLHSISSLVLEDASKANSMIARLGDFLRLTIDNSEQQFVSLKEEMDFLRCYLDIEQVRFGDRLAVNFAMEPAVLSAQVPHLILQPVVENAVQHAIAPRAAPGRIDIEAKQSHGLLRLKVKDNGPGMAARDDKQIQGLGLSNVQARLDQIYGKDFRFDLTNGAEGGLTVVFEIPFRHDVDLATTTSDEESAH